MSLFISSTFLPSNKIFVKSKLVEKKIENQSKQKRKTKHRICITDDFLCYPHNSNPQCKIFSFSSLLTMRIVFRKKYHFGIKCTKIISNKISENEIKFSAINSFADMISNQLLHKFELFKISKKPIIRRVKIILKHCIVQMN